MNTRIETCLFVAIAQASPTSPYLFSLAQFLFVGRNFGYEM